MYMYMYINTQAYHNIKFFYTMTQSMTLKTSTCIYTIIHVSLYSSLNGLEIYKAANVHVHVHVHVYVTIVRSRSGVADIRYHNFVILRCIDA